MCYFSEIKIHNFAMLTLTKLIRLFYSEIRNLHQAAFVLALLTTCSLFLGLIRDRLLAAQFGAGSELDTYYVAFKIPDVLYSLFVSCLSVYVLMPFVVRLLESFGKLKSRQFLGDVFTLFLFVYILISSLLFWQTPWLIDFLFPGIGDTANLALITRILLLQPMLLGISSLFGVISQLRHNFIVFAVSPILYNLGIIFGVVVLYEHLGLIGLAWGVIIGASAHMLVQWSLVYKCGYSFGIRKISEWKPLWSVISVAIPRSLTLSLNQLVILAFFSMASLMTVGSVAVFQLAFNLQAAPLAVIGASYSVAAFPALASLYAKKDFSLFNSRIITALRHIIFLSIPITIICIVLRAQIVRVILGSGKFDWDDTRLTAAVFALLIIALLAQAVNLFLVRVFYASGDTRTPLWVASITTLIAITTGYFVSQWYMKNEVLQIVMSGLLRLSNVVGTEITMLALVYTVTIVLQGIVLLWLVHARFKLSPFSLVKQVTQATISGLCGGVATYLVLNISTLWLNTNTFIGIFFQGLSAGIFGIVVVILVYALLRSPELQEYYQLINNLFKKKSNSE